VLKQHAPLTKLSAVPDRGFTRTQWGICPVRDRLSPLHGPSRPLKRQGILKRPGVRQAHGRAYPGPNFPLRSLIPQRLDNLLVSGKGMATSTIAAAAYRVHSFEWVGGGSGGHHRGFLPCVRGVLPYELVDDLPRQEPLLLALQQEFAGPTATPLLFPTPPFLMRRGKTGDLGKGHLNSGGGRRCRCHPPPLHSPLEVGLFSLWSKPSVSSSFRASPCRTRPAIQSRFWP
jgi:hypothetical protein